MKRKTVANLFFGIGVLLICVAIVLPVVWITAATTNTNSIGIIGGAGLPTYMLVFSKWHGGICQVLTMLGAVSVIVSVIFRILK